MRKGYVISVWTKNMKKMYNLYCPSFRLAKRIAKSKLWKYAKVTDLEFMETKYYVGVPKEV